MVIVVDLSRNPSTSALFLRFLHLTLQHTCHYIYSSFLVYFWGRLSKFLCLQRSHLEIMRRRTSPFSSSVFGLLFFFVRFKTLTLPSQEVAPSCKFLYCRKWHLGWQRWFWLILLRAWFGQKHHYYMP